MSAKFLGRRVGDQQHQRHETFRHQGGLRSEDQSQDIFASGVQIMRPETITGKPLAAGQYYSFGDKEVRTFDGRFRMIDSSVMNQEIATVRANEEAILDMVELFIKSGDDSLCQKYIGDFFKYLPSKDDGFSGSPPIEMLMASGMSKNVANKNIKKWEKVDASPSSLRYMSELGEDFGKGIQKLKVVLSISGLVFDNRSLKRYPEGLKPDTVPNLAPAEIPKGGENIDILKA